MRMRFKPYAKSELESNSLIFYDPKEHKGQWNKLFKNDNPIHLEIGSGFGKFAITMAERNPNINYIAMEMEEKVLVYAARDFVKSGLTNLLGVRSKAEKLTQFFEKGEISKIYLNFSNPWPKRSQHKRRLTHTRLLDIYKQIMPIGSEIEFKTDQLQFFEDSVKYFERRGFLLLEKTTDLRLEDKEDNIVTEYETKWRSQGVKIKYLKAKLIDDSIEK